jgi:hypothetical protein
VRVSGINLSVQQSGRCRAVALFFGAVNSNLKLSRIRLGAMGQRGSDLAGCGLAKRWISRVQGGKCSTGEVSRKWNCKWLWLRMIKVNPSESGWSVMNEWAGWKALRIFQRESWRIQLNQSKSNLGNVEISRIVPRHGRDRG